MTTLDARQVLDVYFLETRAKLLEIAATLDRVDRAAARGELRDDARLKFIADALTILQSTVPNRAELIQQRYSLS
jgi:hypothetical protein